MRKWEDPIYDRTASDITLGVSKAFFNVADWIRIYGNTYQAQAIVNIMLSLSIPVTALTEPTITTIPAVADINAFIANIERLRVAACIPTGAGATALKVDYRSGSGADAPDYIAVNAWERDLFLIRQALAEAAERVLYCGTFNCGSDPLWANGFRRWQGYIEPAYDPHRYVRMGAVIGSGLMRQNRWRSPYDERRRTPRCGLFSTGQSFGRQNSFRRY